MVPVVLLHEDISYNSLKTKHMSFFYDHQNASK